MEEYITNLFKIVVATALFSLLLFVGTAISTDHRVRRYYVQGYMGSNAATILGMTCVYADNPWEGDDRVFCSQDPTETLAFAGRANDLLKGVK